MKLFGEWIILFGICFAAEGLQVLLGGIIPGNLIAMLLLFALLCMRLVRVEQISASADFMLGHMPFFFIPSGVALLSSFSLLRDVWLFLLLIIFITTPLTMGISGKCVERLMKGKGES